MPGTPGPRTGLAAINATGEMPSLLRTTINAVITWLEGNAGISSGGLLSDRPPSTPASPGIAGRKYYANDTGVEYRDTGTGWVALGVELVTSLPSAPYEGQIVDYLADATKGIVWRLRYRAASASSYKWECVGGGELANERPAGTFDVISNTGYAALGDAVQATLPLAGDYMIEWGGHIGAGSLDATVSLAIKLGTATTSDTNAIQQLTKWTTTAANPLFPASRRVVRTGLAAGTVVALQSRVTGGSATVDKNYLNVRPQRVG